jgi:hypothetical protein
MFFMHYTTDGNHPFAHPQPQSYGWAEDLEFFSLKTPDCNHDEQDGHHRGADDWCDGGQRLTFDQRRRQRRIKARIHDKVPRHDLG